MDDALLPKIGDIITFTQMWHSSLSIKESGLFPNGVVTSIVKYDTIADSNNDKTLMGTLAYPIAITNAYLDDSLVYIVRWATENPHITVSYRLINEEWFYNHSFRIVSRA